MTEMSVQVKKPEGVKEPSNIHRENNESNSERAAGQGTNDEDTVEGDTLNGNVGTGERVERPMTPQEIQQYRAFLEQMIVEIQLKRRTIAANMKTAEKGSKFYKKCDYDIKLHTLLKDAIIEVKKEDDEQKSYKTSFPAPARTRSALNLIYNTWSAKKLFSEMIYIKVETLHEFKEKLVRRLELVKPKVVKTPLETLAQQTKKCHQLDWLVMLVDAVNSKVINLRKRMREDEENNAKLEKDRLLLVAMTKSIYLFMEEFLKCSTWKESIGKTKRRFKTHVLSKMVTNVVENAEELPESEELPEAVEVADESTEARYDRLMNELDVDMAMIQFQLAMEQK